MEDDVLQSGSIPESRVSTSGGAATNAGVDFQQRVAALIMIASLANIDLSGIFGFYDEMVPTTIKFEASTPIDDLVFYTSKRVNHYLQIKRTISLSASVTSEFASVIDQFVQQFVTLPNGSSAYWLVVGNGASQKIRNVLRTILDSYRLDPRSEQQNPDTKEDEQARLIFKNQFHRAFSLLMKRNGSEEEFISFAQKVHIAEINIERSQAHEALAILHLEKIAIIPPELLWSVIIVQALSFAKNRQSITTDGLKMHNKRFLLGEPSRSDRNSLINEALRIEISVDGTLSVGKDILLVPNFLGIEKMSVLELYRFDNTCQKRHKYRQSTVDIISTDSPSEVLYRCATMAGFAEYADENPDVFENKEVVIVPANGLENIEAEPCCHAHREVLLQQLNSKDNILQCLHCGKPISVEWAITVELDDLDTPPDIGLIHSECRRPIDRVVGKTQLPWFKDRDYLKGFDIQTWMKALEKGQRLFTQLSLSNYDPRLIVVAWGGKLPSRQRGMYLVAIETTNGTVRHITTRGHLDRFTEGEAVDTANRINVWIEKTRTNGDPMGYSSELWVNGTYQSLVPRMVGEETFLEWSRAMVVPYTEHIARRYEVDGDRYAPIIVFRNLKDGSLLEMGNAILASTDPLTIGRLFENWSRQLGDISSFEIDILSNDTEFDNLMAELESEGKIVVANPIFDSRQKLISGIRIVPQDSIVTTQL